MGPKGYAAEPTPTPKEKNGKKGEKSKKNPPERRGIGGFQVFGKK
jgi:hypothetical protein